MAETRDTAQEYDQEHGDYEDEVAKLPEDQRLVSGSLPKAPDPSPFVVGPMSPGGR